MDRLGSNLVPNSDELAVIERIRRMRTRGMSYQAVADALNKQGIPAKNGGLWYPSSVRAVVLRSV